MLKDYRDEMKEELEKIIGPVQDWINKYGNPHGILVIEQEFAVYYSGDFSLQLKTLDDTGKVKE